VLDFAAAVVLLLAVEVALALPVAAVVGEPVAVAAGLVPGLLVLPLGALLTDVGEAVGAADLADPAWVDAGGHTVAATLLGAAEEAPLLTAPGAELIWVPAPFSLGAAPGVLGLEIPTVEASWTTAWRSGGSAIAKPMANTAQAAARAGRSHPYGCCRSPSPASCPPRMAFQRRVMPARKPPRAAACLLAWVAPELTRARIRSSPSGPGSS